MARQMVVSYGFSDIGPWTLTDQSAQSGDMIMRMMARNTISESLQHKIDMAVSAAAILCVASLCCNLPRNLFCSLAYWRFLAHYYWTHLLFKSRAQLDRSTCSRVAYGSKNVGMLVIDRTQTQRTYYLITTTTLRIASCIGFLEVHFAMLPAGLCRQYSLTLPRQLQSQMS